MRVLDSHLHLWDPGRLDYPWLTGSLLGRFGPAELRAATAQAQRAEPAGFVFVQAECRPEQALAEVAWVAAQAPTANVVGIVGRLAMERGDGVRDDLAALQQEPLVVGVRRLLQDEPAGSAATPPFLAAARAVADAGLAFDACVRADQLPEVTALADAAPDLTIVLDHLGKPPPGPRLDPRWREDLSALAERPGVVCKLSGLPAESPGPWSAATVEPLLDAALEAFGPDRLLFGGDWPVSGPWGRWADAVVDWAARLAPDERSAVLSGTAERVYRL